MSDLDDFKATYFDECSELLAELEEQFAEIEAGERSADHLNAVFRAIHSIKGGAGAFGFTRLVDFAHAFETLLDHVRDGRVELTDEVVALCIRANDIVADFVAAARDEEDLEDERGAEEKARFDALCRGDAPAGDDEPMDEFDIEFTPVRVVFDEFEEETEEAETDEAESGKAETGSTRDGDDEDALDDAFEAAPLGDVSGVWEIHFTPHVALYERANDPLLLFRELERLGETEIRAQLDDLPALTDFEPFGVYCNWAITLKSDSVSEESIREVFEFVEGDCDISIARLGEPPRDTAAPVGDEPEAGFSLADLVDSVKAEASAAADVAETPEPAAPVVPEPGHPSAEGPAEPHPAAAVPAVGADRDHAEHNRRHAGVQSIRVDLEKVDRVVNMVGELVIIQSMLTQQMDETLRAKYQELVRGLEVLAQTTRGLQDSVMAIRAQPVKSVFSRMPRLVRELAAKTGKKIRLETIGENTEIDKTVIEQLSDPLTHMIRNSADHGIEGPEKRVAAGKSETGIVRLSAEQAGGNILIIVEDDGGGINRERVAALARERGIVGADQQLTEEQIDNLIFAPGFSTANAVSDISGRGVGMDVVLSNIKKIGGSVHVRSWPGQGTRMTLRLPLTLAVLDVMLVSVSGSPYVIPLGSILETVQCSRADFGRLPNGARVLQVRGEYVQVVDLASRFDLETTADQDSRFVVLCEAEGAVKLALLVDDIIGQQQVVIKSLEENFERIEGIAGGTILGDGSVALIVDLQGLRLPTGHKQAA